MHGPTNAGGGVSAKGFIQATYPEGSICTCSNGTRTLKARDTSGYMMFILPSIGTWTVTATDPADPTNTDSETVEITTEGQSVSVELSYLVPAEYQAVEYIESTGTQWILTDCYSSAQYSRFVGRGTLHLGAALWRAGNIPYSGFLYAAQAGVDAYPGSGILSSSIAYNADHDIDAEWKGGTVTAVIDGVTYYRTFTGELNTSTAIGLLKVNSSPTKNTVGKLYRCQFYSTEGVLSGDFIPCYRKADSVAGMWDRVSEQFYTNAGTGTFILGADI